MTAPALVLVAQGSTDPRVSTTMHSFRRQLQMKRLDLSVNVAFLDRHCPPTGPQVVAALINRGVGEVVFVPVSLTAAVSAPGVDGLLTRVRAAHPQLMTGVSRPLGPASELLSLVDQRLRSALREANAKEVDGLVLAAPDFGDARGAALLQRRARQWASRHKLPVTVAVADASGPNTAQAVGALRAQGRRHIGVGSLWLAADSSFQAHLSSALDRGAVAVSAPLGVEERLLDMALARYAYAAMALLDDAFEAPERIAL